MYSESGVESSIAVADFIGCVAERNCCGDSSCLRMLNIDRKMSKKKRILLTFVVGFVFILTGALLKLYHAAFANVVLAIGVLIKLVFLYLLIVYFIKSKE